MATTLSRSLAMAAKGKARNYYSAHNFTSTASLGMYGSVDDSDHGCVVIRLYWQRKSKRALEQQQPMAGQSAHHQGEFQHQNGSMHDSDHNGVVRIFVASLFTLRGTISFNKSLCVRGATTLLVAVATPAANRRSAS